MIVIKHKNHGHYLGKTLLSGERTAVKDISKAKRYKSVSTAIAALVQMGYSSKEVEFVEVAK